MIKPFVSLLGSLLLISCASSQTGEATAVKACFQNTYGTGKSVDIEVLTIETINQSVKGVYHWLPAEKDQRKGYLSGKKSGATVHAAYSFYQEGQHYHTNIKVVITPEKALVSGGEPSLGLTTEIKRVDCSQTKSNESI